MSFLGNLFGGGDDSDVGRTNVTTTGAIAPEAKPFVEEIFGEAQKQFKEDEFRLFPGPRIAEFDPLQQKAFTGLESLADVGLASFPSIASSAALAGQAQAAGAEGLRQLDVSDIERLSNPYQQSVIDIQKREALRDFEGATQPQVDALAVQSGSFGGSRHGVLESEAYKNLQEQLGDIQAKGSLQAYNQALAEFGRERQRQAAGAGQYAGFAQQFPSQAAKELTALQAVGETKQTRDQRALDIAFSDFLTEEAFPKQQLGQYASLIRGFPVAGRSTQEVTSLPSVPLGQQLMGLAGTGLAAYQAFAAAGGRIGSLPRGMQSGGQIRGGGLASLERHQNNTRSDPLYARLGPRPSRNNPQALNRWLQGKQRIDHLRKQGYPTEQIVQVLNIQMPPDTSQRRELSIEELRGLPIDNIKNMVSAYDRKNREIPSVEDSMQLLREAAKMDKRMAGAEEYNVIKRSPPPEPRPRYSDPESTYSGKPREEISQRRTAAIHEKMREYGLDPKNPQDAAQWIRLNERLSETPDFKYPGTIPAPFGAQADQWSESMGIVEEEPLRKGDMTEYFNALAVQDERRQGRQDAINYSGTTETHPFLRLQKDDPVKESRIFDVPEGDKSKYQMGEELMREIRRGVRPLKPRRPPVDYMGPPYKTEAVFEPHGPGGAGQRRMPPRDYPALRQEGTDMRYPARTFEESLQEFEPAGPGGAPYDKVAITGILEAINNPRGGRQNLMLPKELRGMEDFELRDLMETIKRNRGWKSSKIKRGPRVSDPRAGSYQQGGLISLANGGKAQSDYPALTFEESKVIDTPSLLEYEHPPFSSTGQHIDPNIDTSSPYQQLLGTVMDSYGQRRTDLDTRRTAADKRLAEQAEKRTALSGKQEEADKRNIWLEAAQMFANYGAGKNFDPTKGWLGNALAAVDFSGIKDINSEKAQRAINELATDERLVTEAIDRDIRRSEQDDILSLQELATAGLINKGELAKAALTKAAEQEWWDRWIQTEELKLKEMEAGGERNKRFEDLHIAVQRNFTTFTKTEELGVLAQLAGKTEEGIINENILTDDNKYGDEADRYLNIVKGIISSKLRPLEGQGIIDVAKGYNKQSVASDEAGWLRNKLLGLDLESAQKLEIANLIKNRMEDGGKNGYYDVYRLVDESYRVHMNNPDKRLEPNPDEYYNDLIKVLAKRK